MRMLGIVGAAVLLALSACAPSSGQPAAPGSGSPTPSTEPTTSPSTDAVALAGTSWEVTAIGGTETIAASRPVLTFTEAEFTGTTGCNNVGGSYTQDAGELTLSDTFVTEMACLDEAVTAQETLMLQALPTIAGVRGTVDAAELTDAAGAVVFALAKKAPVPDRELEGTSWVLTTIVTGDSASSVMGESPLTLTIADGMLHARACNSINGTVTVDGGTLAVGPLASTRMACPSEEETIQEGQYIGGLESASAFEIAGDTLTITTADGSFQFTAEDA